MSKFDHLAITELRDRCRSMAGQADPRELAKMLDKLLAILEPLALAVTVQRADAVSISVGRAAIHMKKDGSVLIEGGDITIKGTGKITTKASGEIVLKGSKIQQN
jgi:hypothetical protein